MGSILWCEPRVEVQIVELGLLVLFLAWPVLLLARGVLQEWLKEGDSFLIEGIKRDAPPGFQLDVLPSAAAYEFSSTCLMIGVLHFAGLLFCLPEVFREVQLEYAAVMIRHAALLCAALGMIQIAAAVRMRYLQDNGHMMMPASTLLALIGLHLSCIIISIPMNIHYSSEYAYVALVLGFHLSGFSANVLSVLAWSLDDTYLPNLPWLWLLAGLDTVISSLVRGPLLIWSLLMLKRLWLSEGAWTLFLFGTAGTLCTVPVSIALLCGSLKRASALYAKTQSSKAD